jgi:hypothetical protein
MFPIVLSTGSKEEPAEPKSAALNQNYPNPFKSYTEISYSIPEIDFVNLTVYDAIGKEIEGLVNEIQVAGTYSINFYGDKLPGGFYYFKLKVGNEFVETRKMILNKR